MSKHDKHEEGYECPYDLNLTDEEEKALSWLNQSLQKAMTECSPRARMSLLAHTAMAKVLKGRNDMHDLLHERDATIEAADRLMGGIAKLEQAKKGLKKGDLN